MPGTCKFKRVEGVWLRIEDCHPEETKDCPIIANYRYNDGDPIVDAGKEPTFLETFRSAFGPTFQFEEHDEMELECDSETTSQDRTSLYRRTGQNSKKFKLNKVDGQEFRKVVVVAS